MNDPRQTTARICLDLPCTICGYNLRTCRVDGVCPECGTAISESLSEPGEEIVAPPEPFSRWVLFGLLAVYGPSLSFLLVVRSPAEWLKLVALSPVLLPAVLMADQQGINLLSPLPFTVTFLVSLIAFVGILHQMRDSRVPLRRVVRILAGVYFALDIFLTLILASAG